MRFIFIDETGNNSQSKYFILGVTSISEVALVRLTTELNELKDKYQIPPKVEVKWNLADFNRQLKNNGLPEVNLERHKEIKNAILQLICRCEPSELSIIWYLSPDTFFRSNAWRSYRFAMNDVFNTVSDSLIESKENAVVLIDELSDSVLRKEEKRKMFEDYIHTIKGQTQHSNLLLIIPNVDSNISVGHQLNDISCGLISYYLMAIHGENVRQVSVDLKQAISDISKHIYRHKTNAVFGAGIHIKPWQVKFRSDLQTIQTKTYDNLRKDFGF